MKNECKIIFLCKDSEKTPCHYHSRGAVCKHMKSCGVNKSCTNPKARISVMQNKLRRMIK